MDVLVNGEWLAPCAAVVALFAVIAVAAAVRLAVSNRRLNRRLDEVRQLQHQLERLVAQDPLTGLYNRRYADDAMARELDRARRQRVPLALMLIDLDHFKRVNDNYGHQAGDEALRLVATLLTANVRNGDVVCRFGGEEFLVMLPATSPATAQRRADEWRRLIERTPLATGGRHACLTASFGVAAFPVHASCAEELVGAADAALYAAKNGGRNRVALAGRVGEEDVANSSPLLRMAAVSA